MAVLTQQELESRLWDAANSLRGPVDPADFKAYIFPILFFKWISDTWDWEHSRAVEEFGDDLNEEIEADYHRFVVPADAHWSELRKVSENVGVELQRMLDKLQAANPDKLASIFGDVAWGNKERIPETSLQNLIDTFDRLKLDPESVSHDMLGNAYEYLLRQFADESGKKAGEFFTPREVVRLITKILDPQPGESMYDPACGSGGMLVEGINEIREAGHDIHTLRIYGQEVNLTTSAIARMNLYLHGIEDHQILRGDTLRQPKFRTQKGLAHFNVVIANPPFSLKKWGSDGWSNDSWGRALWGVPPANSADYAWIQHMVRSMNPDTGRVGVVMPHGVLFRGAKEGEIRKGMVSSGLLEAVIGLPNNLFYSTSIPACVLIFRATPREGRRGFVQFIDASARFTKGRNQNYMDDADVQVVIDAYRAGEDPDGENGLQTRLVPISDIEENSFDLNIGRYIRAQVDAVIDVETALKALQEAEAEFDLARASMWERLKEAGYE
jgi:type I restriction enzyme M protein